MRWTIPAMLWGTMLLFAPPTFAQNDVSSPIRPSDDRAISPPRSEPKVYHFDVEPADASVLRSKSPTSRPRPPLRLPPPVESERPSSSRKATNKPYQPARNYPAQPATARSDSKLDEPPRGPVAYGPADSVPLDPYEEFYPSAGGPVPPWGLHSFAHTDHVCPLNAYNPWHSYCAERWHRHHRAQAYPRCFGGVSGGQPCGAGPYLGGHPENGASSRELPTPDEVRGAPLQPDAGPGAKRRVPRNDLPAASQGREKR